MTEILQKKVKGGGLPPPAEIHVLFPQDPLKFVTTHPTEARLVDLTVYATGRTPSKIAAEKSSGGKRAKPFSGRPKLIAELAPYIYAAYWKSPAKSVKAFHSSLSWWWRLLDECQDIAPVENLTDINIAHYMHYRVNPCERNLFGRLLSVLNCARTGQGMHELYWTAISKPGQVKDLVRHEDVQRLYTHFQQKCKGLLIRFDEDETIEPTWSGVQCLFIRFVIQTGWNPSVVANIDVSTVSEDGTPSCILHDPSNLQYKIIQSAKVRAGGTIQYAHGLIKQRSSCINIIQHLVKQTKPLRTEVKADLVMLQKKHDSIMRRELNITHKDLAALQTKMATCKRKLQSPWLYRGNKGKIMALDHEAISPYGASQLAKAISHLNDSLRDSETPVAANITLTDFRDAFIHARWEKGGFSALAAMIAAGHSNLQSIIHYLNKRQHKRASRESFLKVGEATWQTIHDLTGESAAMSFTTVVAARAKGVEEEKIVHWLGGRNLTLYGTGCQDFFHPPEEIAPHHREGKGCRPQRCILCEHAVILPESWRPFSRRLAELRHIQSTISIMAWTESDYPLEMFKLEAALNDFDQSMVEAEVNKYEAAILDGSHHVWTMEGSYA